MTATHPVVGGNRKGTTSGSQALKWNDFDAGGGWIGAKIGPEKNLRHRAPILWAEARHG